MIRAMQGEGENLKSAINDEVLILAPVSMPGVVFTAAQACAGRLAQLLRDDRRVYSIIILRSDLLLTSRKFQSSTKLSMRRNWGNESRLLSLQVFPSKSYVSRSLSVPVSY